VLPSLVGTLSETLSLVIARKTIDFEERIESSRIHPPFSGHAIYANHQDRQQSVESQYYEADCLTQFSLGKWKPLLDGH
jgi:hypothetical protein